MPVMQAASHMQHCQHCSSAEEKTAAYEEMWRADNENFAVGAAPLFELGSV